MLEYLPMISGGAAVAVAEAVVKELEALFCALCGRRGCEPGNPRFLT